LNHESVYRRLPGGGWTGRWLGEPDRGTDRHQPGGWIYQLLRFMGQDGLAAWGAGLPRAQQLEINGQRANRPVRLLICPSRRSIGPFPNAEGNAYFNCATPPALRAHSDYAACAGDQSYRVEAGGDGPPDLKTGDDPAFWNSAPRLYQTKYFSGVIFLRSQVRMTDISKSRGVGVRQPHPRRGSRAGRACGAGPEARPTSGGRISAIRVLASACRASAMRGSKRL
jgi:hypothetical protein